MPLYPKRIPQIILENKPAFAPNFSHKKPQHPLRISFIGRIRYKEILINLVDALKMTIDINCISTEVAKIFLLCKSTVKTLKM